MNLVNRTLASALSILALSLAVGQASAGSRTSVILDPAGDTQWNDRGKPAPDYHDILRAEVTRKADRFIFRMELAAPLPSSPPPPSGTSGLTLWEWGIDLDPTTAPFGFPFPQNQALDLEIMVMFISDGTRYSAQLWDRRPLLTGGAVVI